MVPQVLVYLVFAVLSMPDQRYDIVIIGGGIVGLSTALHVIRRFPRLRLLLVEKEAGVARHQSGHNSGVVHSGIYYQPGSLKATLCRRGVELIKEFTAEHGLEYRELGKVIVARDEAEMARLRDLQERAAGNGVPGVRWLGAEELHELEPHVRGQAALHSPTTAIVDY